MISLRQLFILVLALALHPSAHAQFTLIPDPNFEQALIDLSLDDLLDGQVLTASIATVEGLNVDNKGIGDLTGIQAFDSLSFLSCKQNSLSSLDVTQNTALVNLDCRLNMLTAVDLTQNSVLQTLRCSDNFISGIDVTQNPLFRYLYCSNNPLTSLDLGQNPELYWLECNNAGLTSLDVTQNTLLTSLRCNGNALSTLDLSQNADLLTLECNGNELVSIDFGTTASMSILFCDNNLLTELETGNMILLESLNCEGNQLSQLDLVSNCLQGVSCSGNQLEYLDLSLSTTMTQVHCSNNPPLQFIDLRNNLISNVSQLEAQNDPNLTCIYVDDATFDHGPNWQYDTLSVAIVETEAECMAFVAVPEHQQGETSLIYPNPANGYFHIESREPLRGLTIYDLSGQEVYSFPYQYVYWIELPSGAYVVRLDHATNKEIKVLLVE